MVSAWLRRRRGETHRLIRSVPRVHGYNKALRHCGGAKGEGGLPEAFEAFPAVEERAEVPA